MKRQTIRQHLRPYSIYGRRVTTINHAFASALAINEDYDDARICQAVRDLGQDPEGNLICCYCATRPAETWDHVVGLVRGKEYSGFGHTIGNLVPCCKPCNSAKGNKDWREFVVKAMPDEDQRAATIGRLEHYFAKHQGTSFGVETIRQVCPEELERLTAIQARMLCLMKEADEIAATIRHRIGTYVARPADGRASAEIESSMDDR